MLGLSYAIDVAGSCYFVAHPEVSRAVSVHLDVKIDGFRRFVRHRLARLDGTCHIEGFASASKATGTLYVRPVEEGRVVVEFSFKADDGGTYLLRGQHDLELAQFPRCIVELHAGIYDGKDEEVARVKLDVDPGRIARALASLRLRAPARKRLTVDT